MLSADTVDIELQILATERENITQLMCTKSRRTRNIVRKGWRRDFFYDEDSLVITPVNEQSFTKEQLINELRELKMRYELSNVAVGKFCEVSERTIRRWLDGTNLPSEPQLENVKKGIESIKVEFASSESRVCVEHSRDEAEKSLSESRAKADATSEPIYKEIKNKEASTSNKFAQYRAENLGTLKIKDDEKATKFLERQETYVHNNVDNANTSKSKKSKASSTKKKSIDLDNPCLSCPALSTKDKRFVDGEGSSKNQWAVVALEG